MANGGSPWPDRFLSTPRLRPYRAGTGDLVTALRRYDWNAAISAAFWEVLEGLEVTLRNAMHNALSEAFGERWFEQPERFDRRCASRIEEAMQRARLRGSTRPSPDRLVSETSLGLWVGLLDRGGPSATGRVVSNDRDLWQPALVHAFPRGPRHRGKTYDVVRWPYLLRNRIAHHDRLTDSTIALSGGPIRLRLDQIHELCLVTAGWIDEEVGSWLRHRSRVPDVLAHRPA